MFMLLQKLPNEFDISIFESIIYGILDFIDVLKTLADSVLGWLPQNIRYIVGVALLAMIVIKVIKVISSKGTEI